MSGCKGNKLLFYSVFLVISLFVFYGLGGSFLFANGAKQETQEKPKTAVEEKAVPAAIPAPDIVIQAQKVSADLHRIQSHLHPSPSVRKVGEEFQFLFNSIKQELVKFEGLEVEHLTIQRLIQVQDQWERHRFKTDAWQRILVLRSQELEALRSELSSMKDLWERTRTVALNEEYSEALLERIKLVLDSVEEVARNLRKRLEAVYSLQDQLSTQLSSIAGVLNTLDLASDNSRKKLFAHDRQPLWKAEFVSDEGVPLSHQVKKIWDLNIRTLGEFIQSNLIRLFVHIGIFLFLGFLFSGLRKHVQEWIEIDERVKASLHILSRPFSVALIVAMILRLWIYPSNPQVVDELSRLILIIPLLRLFPGLVPPEFRRPIYGLGGLYILQLVTEILPGGTLIMRFVVLVLTLLALVGMMWIVKPGGVLHSLPKNRWSRFLVYFFRLSVPLFAVSILSNIVGNVSLAYLIATGTFQGIYGFVLILMGVVVLDGLIFLSLNSRFAQSLRMVRLHNAMWSRGFRRLIRIAAVFSWLFLTLDAMTLLNSARSSVTQFLQRDLSLGTLSISLEDVLAFIITLVVSIYLAKIIRLVLSDDILPRFSLARGVPTTISFVAYYFILLTGFMLALGAAGIEWSRFAILAGALGVGIGFGLQNLVNNFVSGLILIFERPIKVGDVIEFGGQRGEVLRIGIRSSTVRSWEGAEIIVPNGNLISSEVINWTLSDRKRRLGIPVGVAYGTDPNLVIEILNKVAGENSEVLENPLPMATFKGFGESSLDFELRFSIKEFLEFIRIQSELNLAIHAALKAAGIEIPFPQRDLHVRSVNPSIKADLKKPEKSIAKPKT